MPQGYTAKQILSPGCARAAHGAHSARGTPGPAPIRVNLGRCRGALRGGTREAITIPASSEGELGAGSEDLILVDASDRIVGHLDKQRCHDGGGRLHRAFSIFLCDDRGRLVLQQRGAAKRLWAGCWSNSVCGHPRRDEDTLAAAQRRLREELGVSLPLRFLFRYRYQASCADRGSEHELCSVFWGQLAGEALRPDPGEIAAIRRLEPDALTRALRDDPASFTPWLHLAWQRIREEHAALLEA